MLLHTPCGSLNHRCFAAAAAVAPRPPVRGVQFHHPEPTAVDGSEEVGKGYRHASADLQVCISLQACLCRPLFFCFIQTCECMFVDSGMSMPCICELVLGSYSTHGVMVQCWWFENFALCLHYTWQYCRSRPVLHNCTATQVSGEAQYTDDVALPPNTLHAAFVTSKKPHAKLLGVDTSAALAMPGELLTPTFRGIRP